MNPFDLSIIRFLNRFAHHSRLFDGTINALASEAIFKGVFIVALLWWVWFTPGEKNPENRRIVIATMWSAILAVLVGRLLADYLPFRVRPLQSTGLDFTLPYFVTVDALRSWSAFPSDHAMAFFALSTGLCFVSARLGAAATAYVFIVIGLPRVYLGYHYPTDILGGAVFGIFFACVTNVRSIRSVLAAPALRWLDAHPASFYTGFFLFTAGVATLFDTVRHLAITFHSLLR